MKCPDSVEELKELEQLIPLCKVTLYEQAKARKDKYPEKSERQIAKEIADEINKPEGTVRKSIQRGKMGTLSPLKSLNLTKEDEVIIKKAGRAIQRAEKSEKKQKEEKEKIEIITDQANKDLASFCDIKNSSMQDLLKTASPDCIITDPPYPKKYLNLYLELAELSKNIPLVAVMCGQTYLPEVMAAMCTHLKYRWTIAYMTPGGQSVQQWQAKVNTFWKPILLFGEAIEWIGDVCKSSVNDNDKRFHNWGQSESGMLDLIEKLTKPGQLICDPFLGGGTTAVCCIDLGRRFIGCDIDNECVSKAIKRCELQFNKKS